MGACAAPTALETFPGRNPGLTAWAKLWRTSGALEKEEDRI